MLTAQSSMFKKLKHLPDPVLGEAFHLRKLSEGNVRPSLTKQARRNLYRLHRVQHVNSIGLMLQCEECDLWRLLYLKRKLSAQDKTEFQSDWWHMVYLWHHNAETWSVFMCLCERAQLFWPSRKVLLFSWLWTNLHFKAPLRMLKP